MLPLLINELADLAHPVVLVLDDYQVVENQECHRSVAFLIEHLPKTVQLVMSTHSNPPLPLGRLRARGQLLELQGADLRFTGEETAALLNDQLQLKLDSADLAILHDRTEGWPAGLHLAALTLKGHPNPHLRVKSFSGSHRHVIDYLGAELLDAQPPPLRGFLLRTSILERLSADLCDAITDSQGAAGLLRQLEQANLFLLPLDERREWYRYHHLFADLLRHELAASEPELITVLHRRASAWYRQAGFPEEAIHHASAAGDLDEVSQLIARNWISYVDRWLIATVRDWLRALPPAAVRSIPSSRWCPPGSPCPSMSPRRWTAGSPSPNSSPQKGRWPTAPPRWKSGSSHYGPSADSRASPPSWRPRGACWSCNPIRPVPGA